MNSYMQPTYHHVMVTAELRIGVGWLWSCGYTFLFEDVVEAELLFVCAGVMW